MNEAIPKTPQVAFGEVVKEARLSAKLLQTDLYDAGVCYRTYVSQIEAGKFKVQLDLLFRMAEALKIPASELIRRTEQRIEDSHYE